MAGGLFPLALTLISFPTVLPYAKPSMRTVSLPVQTGYYSGPFFLYSPFCSKQTVLVYFEYIFTALEFDKPCAIKYNLNKNHSDSRGMGL